MSLEVKNLLKIYGKQKAVNNISFSINPGEVVGFLGPNGAGKSTTLKIIAGCLLQNSGTATVCGINVNSHALAAKKRIGYLPESNALYYEMYIREYLHFIADIHKISKKQKAINDIIERVGLKSESTKKIGQLSKGYKQRVGLAAALLHQPDVLLLDEPTSGLDPNQVIEIRNLIKQQGADKTVLFSSHILQEVEAICDRIIIIHQAEVVANDSIQALQNKNKKETIIVVQFENPVPIDLFSSVVGVVKTEPPFSLNKTSLHFRITTQQPDLLRKQILELSLQHRINIVSLQSENKSLEEIFQQLTHS